MSANTLVLKENTSDISDTYLELTADSGDVGPSIICFSGSSTSTLSWTKAGIDGGLPVGVTVSEEPSPVGQILKLEWEGKIHFTDSGTYMCTVTNGESVTVGINLFVECK